MKTISRRDFEILKQDGLIQYKTKFTPANFTVINKKHKSIEKRLNEINNPTKEA